MEIKATLHAYLTSDWRQQDFIRAKEEGDQQKMADCLSFSNYGDMEGDGWIKVGQATITVKLIDDKDIREMAVESLKKQKADILAEAQAKATMIEGKIQSLLAIEWKGGANAESTHDS